MADKLESVGRIGWHDLMTTDVEKALVFYKALFGWTTQAHDMGPMGTYHLIHNGKPDIGGIMSLDPAHGAPSHWIGYVGVDDVDAAAKRVTSHGGKIAVP